jgi:hypothetical protein
MNIISKLVISKSWHFSPLNRGSTRAETGNLG